MTRQPFHLTPEQYAALTRPLHGSRVGKNPKGFSHLEAWDVRRWLIRIFGFGNYMTETVELSVVRELEIPPGTIKYRNGGSNEKTVWTVVYRAQVRLTVWDTYGTAAVYEDGAIGDSSNQPSLGDCHDNAAKTALSQALKRCAVNLGDQFGLGLYNEGKLDPVVQRSLVANEIGASADRAALPADDAPVRPEPGTELLDESTPQTSTEAAAVDQTPVDGPAERAHDLSAQIAAATTKEQLTEIWKAFRAAAQAGQLAPGMADQLKAAWTARRDRITEMRHMFALLKKAEITDRDERIRWYCEVLDRTVTTTDDLTTADVASITERTERYIKQRQPAQVSA